MTGRPLNDQERSLLRHLLSVPFDGVADLRTQVDRAVTTSPPGANLDLAVPETAPLPGGMTGAAPIIAEVTRDSGYAGELLLWLRGGLLAGVEYAWVTDEPPSALPAPGDVRVRARHD